jgi:hypothetical protein
MKPDREILQVEKSLANFATRKLLKTALASGDINLSDEVHEYVDKVDDYIHDHGEQARATETKGATKKASIILTLLLVIPVLAIRVLD